MGEVKDLMQSCLMMKPEEGYTEARRLLKEKYGQNYRIATALMNRVTELHLVSTYRKPSSKECQQR
jgi:hypothetical protein